MPSDTVTLDDGRSYLPDTGMVTKDPLGESVSIMGTLPDSRVLFRVNQGEGQRPIFKIIKHDDPDIFAKPNDEDGNKIRMAWRARGAGSAATEASIGKAAKGFIQPFPTREKGEGVGSYLAKNAPLAAATTLSMALPFPGEAKAGAGLLERVLPFLKRAGIIAGGTLPVSVGSQLAQGQSPDVGTTAIQTLGLPAMELGLHGAMSGVQKFAGPGIPSAKSLATDFAKPENAAFARSMQEAGIPVTRGQITQSTALTPIEQSMGKSMVGRKMIQNLNTAQEDALRRYTSQSVLPMERQLAPEAAGLGFKVSSPELGGAIQDPIIKIRKIAADLERERRSIEEGNESARKLFAGKGAANIKPEDLGPANKQILAALGGGREFPAEKQEKLDAIRALLSHKSTPGLRAITSAATPETVAHIMSYEKPSMLSSYMKVLDSDVGNEIFTPVQISKAKSAVRLAFVRNATKMVEGTEPANASGLVEMLGGKRGVTSIANGKFGSPFIPKVVRDIAGSDEEGQNAVRYLGVIAQTADRLGGYKSGSASGLGYFSIMRALVRNMMGPSGMAKLVFTPVGQEFIDKMATVGKPHFMSPPTKVDVIRMIETLNLARKASDSYFGRSAQRPEDANTAVLQQAQ